MPLTSLKGRMNGCTCDTIPDVWSKEHLLESRWGCLLNQEMLAYPRASRAGQSYGVIIFGFTIFSCVDQIFLMKSNSANLSHHSTLFSSGHTHFQGQFFFAWLVTAGESLFAKAPSELIGEQCWEWLVKLPGRSEMRGGEAYGMRQSWSQQCVLHAIRFSTEVVSMQSWM